jgi:hypothetical protein
LAKTILDYKADQAVNRVGGTNLIIPHLVSLRLSVLKINIPTNSPNNRVELLGTVGVKGITGISQVLLRVFRDGVEIFRTQQGIESSGSEQTYTVAFQDIDVNVRPGTHFYRLGIQNITNNTRADVVGPVNFSALAVSQ